MLYRSYMKVILTVISCILIFTIAGRLLAKEGDSMIENANFEKGTGWEDWGGFSYISDNKHVYAGKRAVRLVKSEGGAGNTFIDHIEQGQSFTLSGYGKVSGQGQEALLGVECLDEQGNKIAGGRFTVKFTKEEYLKKEITFTTVAGTKKLLVYLYVINIVPDGATYFDELSLTPVQCTTKCQTNNAAFLSTDWFNTIQAPNDIAVYVKELKDKEIKYQLADIGMLTDQGTLAPAKYAGLANWIKYSKQADPKQLIIVVMSYNKRVVTDTQGDKVPNKKFGSKEFNTNINALVDKLVNKGVQINGLSYNADGVHVDFESFFENDTTLLQTLKHLRTNALVSNRYFSISSPVNFSRTKTWDDHYINKVARVVNQINPMVYDQMGWGSSINDPDSYQRLWTSEIKRYSDAIGEVGPFNQRSQLVPFMPSYERRVIKESLVVYHDPYVENMGSAILGLNSAIAEGANVHGAAIFWWPTFMGHYPYLYPESYYLIDQNNWNQKWVNSF